MIKLLLIALLVIQPMAVVSAETICAAICQTALGQIALSQTALCQGCGCCEVESPERRCCCCDGEDRVPPNVVAESCCGEEQVDTVNVQPELEAASNADTRHELARVCLCDQTTLPLHESTPRSRINDERAPAPIGTTMLAASDRHQVNSVSPAVRQSFATPRFAQQLLSVWRL